MNWARGLKFAGIHVAIAIPLVASVAIPRWETRKLHSEIPAQLFTLAAYQEEGGTVSFSPCEIWRSYSWQEKVLMYSETPAYLLSGWDEICPPAGTVAGLLGIDSRHHTGIQEAASSACLCGLIAIQWVLLGALPLIKPRRWWLEPGATNTCLMCIGLAAALLAVGLASTPLPHAENIAAVPGLIAQLALWLILLTWIEWLCLIAWQLARFGWQVAAASLHRARSR
jgi:hypothetical protein